jgi:hypothetical protein
MTMITNSSSVPHLWTRSVELVVDQREPFAAGQRQTSIHPVLPQLVFYLHYAVDEVIHNFFAGIASLVANQVRGFELVIAKQQHDWPGEHICQMQRQGGLAGACRAAQVN